MLICKNCNLEYEDGKNFCGSCGSPLIRRYKPLGSVEESGLKESKSEGPKVCPKCRISFETGNYCRRCGAALIQQYLPTEKTDIQRADLAKDSSKIQEPEKRAVEPQETVICPKCTTPNKLVKFCKKCGALLQSQSSESPPATPIKDQKIKDFIKIGRPIVTKKKPFSRPTIIGTAAIILLIVTGGGVYLLWPKYSYLIRKKPPSMEQIQKAQPPTPDKDNISAPKTGQTSGRQTEAEIIESIKNTLETIRQANLQKNIELFMSCYSSEFKEKEQRRSNTLENWNNFDYLDLSYSLKNVNVLGVTAEAKVEWFALMQPRGGAQTREQKFVLDVIFLREEGGWKIKETRPAS